MKRNMKHKTSSLFSRIIPASKSELPQVTASVWEEGETSRSESFSVVVDPARAHLRNPFGDKKWRKFQISTLFGGYNSSPKVQHIDVLTRGGQGTNPVIDRWIMVQSLGSGHTRDMALDRWGGLGWMAEELGNYGYG